MYESVLQNQQNQLQKLQSLETIERDILPFAKSQLDHNLIKIVTGSRRVGKSVLALQMLKNQNFAYLNFDDPDLDLTQIDYAKLTQSIDSFYQNPSFILFDEIQNLPKWEVYLNSLQRENRNLVVTGSNAKLLSKELATTLTGRAVEISVLPFDLHESKMVGSNFENILLNGSYPEVLTKTIDPSLYYQSLFNTSIIKDVVTRYSLRHPQNLENTAKYLLNTVTNRFSYQSLKQKLNLSVPTIISYIQKLEETYLFYLLPRFSTKPNVRNVSDKKIYCSDFALAKFNTPNLSENYGFALENAVFIELLRQGYKPGITLFYYLDEHKNEVDFLILEKNNSVSLIQVCFSVSDDKTLFRELTSLQNFSSKNLVVNQKILITQSPTPILSSSDIQIMNFEDFS